MQVEMTVTALIVDPTTNGPIVILRERGGQRILSICVGIVEANAIVLAIEAISTPRPMTHDLLRNVIHDLKSGQAREVGPALRRESGGPDGILAGSRWMRHENCVHEPVPPQQLDH